MKEANKPKAIFLSEYQAPEFWVDTVELHFLLNEDSTRVENRMSLRRNSERGGNQSLTLDGSHSKLISVTLDGRDVAAENYTLDEHGLQLPDLPDEFVLTVVTEIEPQLNTALEGLYKSSGNYCTQCEAQGFRRITYYPDRPDVMACFTVSIDADKNLYPVLLSNGNPIERGNLDNGRHFVTWHDPHPKPSYLFALVAGDLSRIEDSFITASGREVCLEIYVESHNAD
jgi:aminopeptidase N